MKRHLKRLSMILVFSIVTLTIWGLSEPYFLKVEKQKAYIPELPSVWEHETIAVLGDFQIGMWLANRKTVEKSIEKVIELQPGAVILLGDFLYHPEINEDGSIRTVMDVLKPLLSSDIPIFTVLGNHDYGMDNIEDIPNSSIMNDLKKELEKNGVRVLQNETIALQNDSDGVTVGRPSPQSLYLAGIGASWPNNAQPEKVLHQMSDSLPRIVVMHNPDAYEDIPSLLAPLAIAGHTHGSQIEIPLLSTWLYNTVLEDGKVHASGWITDFGQEGNRLYVNRGIGFSNLPIRINCPPELTIFELLSK
ncbi:metallophosphoesterase [Radiobacillus deserti]|uniref:Metallophosphoesterase n=1 Tax=Radiobacillus deserti TaxID=2594883 RepID=A0A516KG25_9BACI|nr:metallophosphoesterase [Radiobacillus deserti]QDP40362.1 metallophosphoesterase [Radiobacillus deserti]